MDRDLTKLLPVQFPVQKPDIPCHMCSRPALVYWHNGGKSPLRICRHCATSYAVPSSALTEIAEPHEEPPPKTPQEKQLRVLVALTQAHSLLREVLDGEVRQSNRVGTHPETEQRIARIEAVLGKVTRALQHFPPMPQSTSFERIMNGETEPEDGEELLMPRGV